MDTGADPSELSNVGAPSPRPGVASGLHDEADRLANETAFPMTTSSGLRVLIRALRPSDADELEEGFDQLSSDSRYLRFFTPVHVLNKAMLARFVAPDHLDHVAIGAVDATTAVAEGIGVARAFRSKDDETAAEFAVAVIDSYHSKGVGSLLLDALGVACARVGITTLTADVLSTNTAMLSLVERRGGTRTRVLGDASVTEVAIPVVSLTRRVDAVDRQRIVEHLADLAR